MLWVSYLQHASWSMEGLLLTLIRVVGVLKSAVCQWGHGVCQQWHKEIGIRMYRNELMG